MERKRGLEWSREQAWEILAAGAVIEDRALALPLPIRDLVSAAKADDAVARALLAKASPVLTTALDEARTEGKAEGKAEAVLAVLASRGIDVDPGARAAIAAMRDKGTLDRWLALAATCADATELLG